MIEKIKRFLFGKRFSVRVSIIDNDTGQSTSFRHVYRMYSMAEMEKIVFSAVQHNRVVKDVNRKVFDDRDISYRFVIEDKLGNFTILVSIIGL